MEENQTPISVAANVEVRNVDVIQAKRKRMMLAEVYVHKCRRLDTESSEDDKFDVFHIYEFDVNDLNIKITPKLSTNCTEPGKIIDVLENSTGSDTPQLLRLIEKLQTQNKKWCEIQNSKNIHPNGTTNNTNGIPTVPVNGMYVDASTNAISTQSMGIVTPPEPLNPPASATAPNLPIIRVKAIESLKENQVNVANPATSVVASKTVTAPKSVADPKTVNPMIPIRQRLSDVIKKRAEKTYSVAENRNQSSSAATTNSNEPVKLWNNVIQKSMADKQLEYLVVADKTQEKPNKDKSVYCLKLAEEVIENSKENNSSSLKIGQVYECVSDEFVEDLLVEKSTQPVQPNHIRPQPDRPQQSSTSQESPSPSPLLDSLVDEVQAPVNTNANPINKLTFARINDGNCSDYRCNICLKFNETFMQFKSHMINQHLYRLVCDKCHEAFTSRIMYEGHLDANNRCVQRENASRNFICIVDPPVILMKNNQVYAFRCKHCLLAFHNQRNYVQHSQRHAKLFRCKVCPTPSKTMSTASMQQHLQQH